MTQERKITINDVALAAGVSVSTVSLVLSGKGRISAATGQRVSEAVEKLGFVRNRQASALRGGQSGIIGLIARDVCHPFYAQLIAGLTDALERQERMLILSQSGRDGQQMLHCFETLLNQGVDGVIIAGAAGMGAELREKAEQKGIPLVFASRASYLDEADTLRPDNLQAAQMLTEHLIKQGHQRIAWLGGNSGSLTRAERLGGYCATLLQYGLPFHSEWVVECENSQKQAAEAIGALLRHNPTISAVICHNSTIALGAWFGLMRAGLQSSESGMESYFDRSVALGAFTELSEDKLEDIPVTWMSLPAQEMGREVAERMAQRIEKGHEAARHHVLGGRLIKRK